MGTVNFHSRIKELSDLVIHPLPNHKVVHAIFAFRHERETIFIGADGKLYSDTLCYRNQETFRLDQFDERCRVILAMLVKLNVITQAQMTAHLQYAKAADAKRRQQHQAENAVEGLAKVGLLDNLPAAIQKKLEAMRTKDRRMRWADDAIREMRNKPVEEEQTADKVLKMEDEQQK